MKCQWFICLLIVASVVVDSGAEALASVDEKSAINQLVEAIVSKGQQRENHAMKSDDTYLNYAAAPGSVPDYYPSSLPQPILAPSFSSNPNDTTMGFVYYYLPTVEKYYPKVRDLLPYLKSLKEYEPMAKKAWPIVRRAADRTFSIGSVLAVGLLVPVMIISTVGFLVFVVTLFLFPALSAFGKRRFGRSVESDPSELDFDQLLPVRQSRALAQLAARIDDMVESYAKTLKSDSCLERLSCHAGQITSRLGKFTRPVVEFLEPMIPSYMYNKLTAFKRGARSGTADCSDFKCKLPFFNN